jgi:hypothetical protein
MSALNAASKRLLGTVFPNGGAYLVTGKYDANDNLVPGKEGPAGSFDLPDDRDLYYCVGSILPGKDRTAIERVWILVIDDVGKEIDQWAFDAVFPLEPSYRVESSPGSWHYLFFIEGDMAPDEFRALRLAMRSNALWGDAHNTGAAAIYRLPQGIHSKSTYGGWKVRGDSWTGNTYLPETLWNALAPAGAPRAPGRGSAGDLVEDEALLDELVDLIPNDVWDWDKFVNTGRAIWGASNGLADGTFHRFAAKYKGNDPDVTQARWDSYHDASIGRYWLLRAAKAADPAGAEAWLRKEAQTVFTAIDEPPVAAPKMFTVDDFRSVVNEVDFVHVGTGAFWKPASVDANVPPVPVGNGKTVKATAWMRAYRKVTELSWLPGRERIIANASMGVMGLQRRPLHSIFNLYQAPDVVEVGEVMAEPWLDLVRRLWPDEADEILNWFAHRVQRPGEKCNHALVLGGAPGIGKDTVLEGVRRAVGVGNCYEILPSDLRSNFNDYVKSVLLVVNELRDDGQLSQYAFYDKSKTLIAAPPYTVKINSKYLKQYAVPNVCGVVMTSNYKETGLYLPADDRRHLVCWSDADAIEEGDKEFAALWAWLEGGGFDHVAAWLRAKDISGFDAKAPPRKTKAFQDIVDAGGSVEERALADKIEKIGRPGVLRIGDLKSGADEAFDDEAVRGLDAWLHDPKYRKVIAEALGRAGYRKIRNPGEKDGRWKIDGRNETVYGFKGMSDQDLRALAGKLGKASNSAGSA